LIFYKKFPFEEKNKMSANNSITSMSQEEMKSKIIEMEKNISNYNLEYSIIPATIEDYLNLSLVDNGYPVEDYISMTIISSLSTPTGVVKNQPILVKSVRYQDLSRKYSILALIIAYLNRTIKFKDSNIFAKIYGVHIGENQIGIFCESNKFDFGKFVNNEEKLYKIIQRMSSFIKNSKEWLKFCIMDNFIITDENDCTIKYQLVDFNSKNKLATKMDDIAELGIFVIKLLTSSDINNNLTSLSEKDFVDYFLTNSTFKNSKYFQFAYRCMHHGDKNSAQIFVGTMTLYSDIMTRPITNHDRMMQNLRNHLERVNSNYLQRYRSNINNNDNNNNNNNNRNRDRDWNNNDDEDYIIDVQYEIFNLAIQRLVNYILKIKATKIYIEKDKRLDTKICNLLDSLSNCLIKNKIIIVTNIIESDFIICPFNGLFPPRTHKFGERKYILLQFSDRMAGLSDNCKKVMFDSSNMF
jgi:hypothetical protein